MLITSDSMNGKIFKRKRKLTVHNWKILIERTVLKKIDIHKKKENIKKIKAFRMTFYVEYHNVGNYTIKDENCGERLSSFENCREGGKRDSVKWAKAGFKWNYVVDKLRC